MLRHDNKFFTFSIVAATLAALNIGTPALAGDGNTLYVLQSGSAGTNSLYVDQFAADNSIVAGNTLATEPAFQKGGHNTGEIKLMGDGAIVLFGQVNTRPDLGNNSAKINGDGLATIVLQQNGYGNEGTLNVGSGQTGALFQYGDWNKGAVTVSDSGISGTLYQKGNNNEAVLTVNGTNGASVQWNQIGNNMKPLGVTPMEVITNVPNTAGTITITQSTY